MGIQARDCRGAYAGAGEGTYTGDAAAALFPLQAGHAGELYPSGHAGVSVIVIVIVIVLIFFPRNGKGRGLLGCVWSRRKV